MASTTVTASYALTHPISHSRSTHESRTRRLPISSAPLNRGASPSSPPPSSQMSFNMSQGSHSSSAIMQQSGSFRQYGDTNGSQRSSAPQIYSAVYSGVDVYEMEVNGVAVMRRRNDSWLNATQILKVAGIDKGRRTKVLEKEILIGEHEKVQGGYGKYQGTWIKFDRGLEFCRQYGVEEALRPLLTYDMGQDGGVAGQGGLDTPTKEQAMAAQRKRLYNANNEAKNGSQSGTFFKNISRTASHAVAAISKARLDSPGPRVRHSLGNGRPPTFSRQSSSQQLEPQEAMFPGGSQQSVQSFTTENSFTGNGPDSAYGTMAFSHGHGNSDFQEPLRKRIRTSPGISNSQQTNDSFYGVNVREVSPTEANDSFVYQQSQTLDMDDDVIMSVPPLPMPNTNSAESKRAMLMSLFMDPSRVDFSKHEVFLKLSGEDLDMPIDNSAHTALHWAATLARLPLLKALIAHGASIYRVNVGGETALMRACVVANNLDMGSFPDLLELLGPTIELRDGRGRTVLHHIAVTSAVRGRSSASKYYLESLLEFVVRQGSAPNSQQSFLGSVPQQKSMGIGRFMSEIVNAQDKSGDTALNIAARIGNRSIISQLREVGADAGIANRAGLRPVDFGIGDPTELGDRLADPFTTAEKSLSKGAVERSTELINSITSLLSETQKEFSSELTVKQSAIDAIHAQLRESSAQLGEENRRLQSLKARVNRSTQLKQRVSNLRRAVDQEKFKLSQLQQSDAGRANNNSMVNGNGIVASLGDADRGLAEHGTLHARVDAYVANNNILAEEVDALKAKSIELEAKYRKVISLCTRVDEERVDSVMDNLLRAVSSEHGDVELGRVRDFLQRVESVE